MNDHVEEKTTNPSLQPRIGVAVLARVAELGRGKTRLAKHFGAEATVAIYRELIAACAGAVRGSGLPARVYFDPAPGDADVWESQTFAYASQPSDADLGVRLAAVASDALQHFDGVLLLGTDCPYLTAEHLKEAAQVLRKRDAVLGPSLDGGYYLLGIKRFEPALFSDIEWSTSVVAEQTRQVLAEAGLSTGELSALSDIDEPADWEEYRRWRSLAQA